MSEPSNLPDIDVDVFGRKRKRKGDRVGKKSLEGNTVKNQVTNNDGEEGPKQKQPKVDLDNKSKRSTPVSQILRGINVAHFAEARALEISNTMEALKEATSMEGKRVFQRLPRHMRRRAASYNRRRIPRRLRMKALQEEKKAPPMKKTKMPSRKHRRRPKNLTEEYNRRRMNHAWLETHIWHAKRFKMVEKWGYKLAEQPCDKGFRSTYRASAHGCIMQDISYYGCIEVSGSQEVILNGLRHHSPLETGAKFSTQDILSGKIESSLIMYHYDCYPGNAIGPVSIIWKPVAQKQDGKETASLGNTQIFEAVKEGSETSTVCGTYERTVWIWCHPTCHDELLEALKNTYSKIIDTKEDFIGYCGSKDCLIKEKDFESIAKAGNAPSNVSKNSEMAKTNDEPTKSHSKEPKILSEKFCIGSHMLINSLKMDFFKIRLTGPFSHKVLVNALQLHKPIDSLAEEWWHKYYQTTANRNALMESNEAWKMLENIQSLAELPPHVVMGITVVDPRLNIPLQKTWPMRDMKAQQKTPYDAPEKRLKLLTNWSSKLSNSALWNEDIRKEVKNTKITEAELNQKRSEKLALGEHIIIEDDSSRIPIMLIQRPGVEETNQNFSMLHYGSGWDLIVPSGWGMAFWVSLVYRGAHVGGQREERNVHLEMKSPYFPKEYPDSAAGKKHLEDERQQKQTKYDRYPPNKRPNHQKLGIEDPFGFSWQKIVDEWSNVTEDVLKSLSLVLLSKRSVSCGEDIGDIEKADESLKVASSLSNEEVRKDFYVLRDRQFLWSIKEHFLQYKAYGAKKRSSAIRSKILEEKLKLLTPLLEKHLKAIVPISFQCIGKGEVTDNAVISVPSNEDLNSLVADAAFGGPSEPTHRGLKAQFPAISDSVEIPRSRVRTIGLCTRWTIGHVTSGRYSLSCGRSAGLGFISVVGLVLSLLMQRSDSQGCLILVRNTNSKQYRFAKMDIILP